MNTVEKLQRTKKQEVSDVIAQIDAEHRRGDLSANEAAKEFGNILTNLKTYPGLTHEEIEELAKRLIDSIDTIPQVEQEEERKHNEAINAAKERYKKQGFFAKAIEYVNNRRFKDLKSNNKFDDMTTEQIDGLFRD